MAKFTRRNALILGGGAVIVVAAGTGAYFISLPPSETESSLPQGKKTSISIGITEDIPTLNPVRYPARGGDSTSVISLMFEPLMGLKSLPGGAVERAPVLATSMTPVQGLRTIRIKLREGVLFHDGTPLTSESLKASLLTVYKGKTSVYPWYRGIADIEIVDDLTADVVWRGNTISNMVLLQNIQFPYLFSATAIEKYGMEGLDQNAIGTGPYIIKEYLPGTRFVFQSNENYWGPKPTIDEVIYVIVRGMPAMVAALQAGQIDAARVEPGFIAQLKETKFDIASSGTTSTHIIYMNTLYEPLNDVRVRRAISYAIDKKGLIALLENMVTEANGLLQPWQMGYDPNLKNYPYDVKIAKDLLADAGYKDGFELNITASNLPQILSITQAYQGMLQSIAIDAKHNPMAFITWLTIRYNKNQDTAHMWNHPYGAGDPEPIRVFDEYFTNKRRVAGREIPFIDDMMEKSSREMDAGKRAKIYGEINKHILENAYMIFAFQQGQFLASNQKFQVRWPDIPTPLFSPTIWKAAV